MDWASRRRPIHGRKAHGAFSPQELEKLFVDAGLRDVRVPAFRQLVIGVGAAHLEEGRTTRLLSGVCSHRLCGGQDVAFHGLEQFLLARSGG